MQQMGGRIVNISSSHSLVFQRRTTAYTVAKGALNTLTQALAVEFGPQGITVNCIAAGAVSTPGWPASPQGEEAWIRRAPRARMGLAADIADAVVFSPRRRLTTLPDRFSAWTAATCTA